MAMRELFIGSKRTEVGVIFLYGAAGVLLGLVPRLARRLLLRHGIEQQIRQDQQVLKERMSEAKEPAEIARLKRLRWVIRQPQARADFLSLFVVLGLLYAVSQILQPNAWQSLSIGVLSLIVFVVQARLN